MWWGIRCTFKNNRAGDRLGYFGAAMQKISYTGANIQEKQPKDVQMRMTGASRGVYVLFNDQTIAQYVYDHRNDVLDEAQINRRFVHMAQPEKECNHTPERYKDPRRHRYRCTICGISLSTWPW